MLIARSRHYAARDHRVLRAPPDGRLRRGSSSQAGAGAAAAVAAAAAAVCSVVGVAAAACSFVGVATAAAVGGGVARVAVGRGLRPKGQSPLDTLHLGLNAIACISRAWVSAQGLWPRPPPS